MFMQFSAVTAITGAAAKVKERANTNALNFMLHQPARPSHRYSFGFLALGLGFRRGPPPSGDNLLRPLFDLRPSGLCGLARERGPLLGRHVSLVYREHTHDKLLFSTQHTLFLPTVDAWGSGYLRKLLIEATPLHRLNISKEAATASSPL
jgi:hypothetical protein